MSRTLSLLASLRIANAPSVISNVWLGYMLGWVYWGGSAHPAADLTKLVMISICLYFAGNLGNDWFDREWDKKHRPERALPSGKFSPFSYLVGAGFLAVNAALSAATISYHALYTALGIVLCIIVYTRLHKHTRWSVIPMGLCRAGLYGLGFFCASAASITEQHSYGFARYELLRQYAFITTHAVGLLVYIAGLTLAARYEARDDPPHGMVVLSRAMLFLPIAAMTAWWMAFYPLTSLLGIVPFAIWLGLCLTRYRQPVPTLVSALLAGIPLIDFMAALPLAGSMMLAGGSLFSEGNHPLLLATILVPLIAFALGRLLQKITPAT